MFPILGVLRTRQVWELAGRPACSHTGIEVEHDPDFGGPTGDLVCVGCGKVWMFDPELADDMRPESDPSYP